MSYLTQARLMTSGDFVGRVNVACLTAAAQITTEEGFDWNKPASPRHRLAGEVARGAKSGLDNFVRACALNSSISAAEDADPNTAPDGDIQYVVNSNWDIIAGIVAQV